MNKISIRNLKKEDCKKLSDGFVAQGWDKPESQYLQYLKYQETETRIKKTFSNCGDWFWNN